jgi:hypothetical protein
MDFLADLALPIIIMYSSSVDRRNALYSLLASLTGLVQISVFIFSGLLKFPSVDGTLSLVQ